MQVSRKLSEKYVVKQHSEHDDGGLLQGHTDAYGYDGFLCRLVENLVRSMLSNSTVNMMMEVSFKVTQMLMDTMDSYAG